MLFPVPAHFAQDLMFTVDAARASGPSLGIASSPLFADADAALLPVLCVAS